jgi:hypothetical protein
MPYKRRRPVDVREMKKTRWHGHYTICQKLRDLYNKIDDEEIKLELRVMMAMTKSMHKKLTKNKILIEELEKKVKSNG